MSEDPISELLRSILPPADVERLRVAGYMSPQGPTFTGMGFACAMCDKYKGPRKGMPAISVEPFRHPMTGFCLDPTIITSIEHSGCCNRFSFRGVNTIATQ